MKSSATLVLLCLLPSIHAIALPQLFDSELESTSSNFKRDSSGKLVPRYPRPGKTIPEATTSMTDDSSLDHPSTVKRDLSARSPQGPTSNPGEFTGFDLSRANPANHPKSSGTSSSSSGGTGGHEETIASEGSDDQSSDREVVMVEGVQMAHRQHHNSSHHRNSTRHAHRKEGILTEFNAHGEHIVVYNGTHFPNGTSYSPANTTAKGGKLLGEVVVAGDEVAVYRRPGNATHHHHHHYNETVGPDSTATTGNATHHHHHHHHNETVGPDGTVTTGIWLPSGTGWIPSSTGTGHPHRKVPSEELAGFRGPKSREKGKFVVVDEYFSKLVKSRK